MSDKQSIDENRQPGIRIVQIFLERVHFEHRTDFLSFPPNTAVQLASGFTMDAGVSADGRRARVRVRVVSPEDREELYKYDLTITGLFEVEEGQENMPLAVFVKSHALALLVPFLREAVAAVTGRGRFGPLWINPLNTQLAEPVEATERTADTLPKPTMPEAERSPKRKRRAHPRRS